MRPLTIPTSSNSSLWALTLGAMLADHEPVAVEAWGSESRSIYFKDPDGHDLELCALLAK